MTAMHVKFQRQGGPDNLLSGFAQIFLREQEVALNFTRHSIRPLPVTSRGLRPPGQQVVRATLKDVDPFRRF